MPIFTVPMPGRAGRDTTHTFSGLAPGLYSWAVRSLGTDLRASDAVEGPSFVIGQEGGLTVSREGAGGVPASFEISRPWPNPARSSLQISVTVPETTEGRLHWYDALGRRVQSSDVLWIAAGTSTVQIPVPDNLGAGTYRYRLSTDRGWNGTGAIVIL